MTLLILCPLHRYHVGKVKMATAGQGRAGPHRFGLLIVTREMGHEQKAFRLG